MKYKIVKKTYEDGKESIIMEPKGLIATASASKIASTELLAETDTPEEAERIFLEELNKSVEADKLKQEQEN